MGFLSGRGAAAFADSFLRSYDSFSKQQREQEEDDRKKAQMAATSGFLSRLPGFKDMGDMTNVDPATAYQVYNHQEALRAKQDELNRKRQVADNTAKLYGRVLPQGAIPEGADLTDVDLGILKSMYEADQKNKQQQARNQFEMEQQNRSFGQQRQLKGMPTYADTHKEGVSGSSNFGDAPAPQGKDIKAWAINALQYYQTKKDKGEPFTKQDEAGLKLAQSQLDETRQMNDGSIVRVSPGLSVLGGNDQQPGKQVVEQITKSDIPLSEVTKNKEKARAVAEVVDTIEQLKEHVGKYGLITVRAQNPEAYERQNSIYQTAVMNMKNAEGLGALQAAEIELTNRMMKDPSTLAAKLSGEKATTGTYDKLMNNYINRIQSYKDLTDGQADGMTYLENMRARRKQQTGKYSSPIPSSTGMRPVFGGGQ